MTEEMKENLLTTIYVLTFVIFVFVCIYGFEDHKYYEVKENITDELCAARTEGNFSLTDLRKDYRSFWSCECEKIIYVKETV